MNRSYRILITTLIFGLLMGCKAKPKKSLEELPTPVATFSPEKYITSTIDSTHLDLLKRFGTIYDTSVYRKDLDSIATYIKRNELEEVYFTKSGVAYAVKKYGRGEYPNIGDRLQVEVETKRWDGKTIFSTAALKQTLEFVVGVGQVVPAWDEVLPNLPAGTEVLIIAPSAMSYGKKAIPKVLPGNTILIYEVVIDQLIPDQPNNKKGITPNFNIEDDNIPVSLRRPEPLKK